MAKVTFRRFLTDNEARSSDIIDGQFIITKDGKSYIDYGTDRVPTNGTLDKQMSDTSLNGVENKVIKKYIDDNINQTKQYSKDYTDNKAKETYSTDEIVVGTWIDGKPIYRKIVDIGNLPNNTNKYIAHNINIETPIKCSGICYNPSASMRFTLPMPNTNIWLDINQICVLTTVDRTNTTAKAIIEYTKTTDEVAE